MEPKKREKDEKKLLRSGKPRKKPYQGPKLQRVGTVEELTGVTPKS